MKRPQCLGAVEFHASLISSFANAYNRTDALGLTGHVLQTKRAQTTSRASSENVLTGFCGITSVSFMLPFH